MAFEDDMIEAGYSDEQEYLDSLIDDFESNFRRQQERELEYYDDDYDSYDYEEEQRERREKQLKQEEMTKRLNEWKTNNPDISQIWDVYYREKKYLDNTYNRGYVSRSEYDELQVWLKERERFDIERKKNDWPNNTQKLFNLYKNELFDFYFPREEECINMSIISQQARELQSIEFYEPSLWETVCSCYAVNPKLFDGIEEKAFWEKKYNSEMDYEYWKDNNIEKYNQFAKKFIAESASYWNNAFCEYGEWMKKHEKEGIEWKQKNLDLWDKYKRNYEIREKNKYIESKIQEYKDKKRRRVRYNLDSIEDYFDLCDNNAKPFLPDIECTEEMPYDINSLDEELHQFIQDSMSSLDMINISADSSKYADKVMTQLWIYTNRDEWEMDALKKNYGHLFRYGRKYSDELITWWKEKYPIQWNDFVKAVVPIFKNNFEIVMKFRLWALNGHKEEFFSIADKYLIYWQKALKLMHGEDIAKQLNINLLNFDDSDYHYAEDIDHIKKHFSSNNDIKIWLKEMRDQVIWENLYNKKYHEHYSIEYMYKSLYK